MIPQVMIPTNTEAPLIQQHSHIHHDRRSLLSNTSLNDRASKRFKMQKNSESNVDCHQADDHEQQQQHQLSPLKADRRQRLPLHHHFSKNSPKSSKHKHLTKQTQDENDGSDHTVATCSTSNSDETLESQLSSQAPKQPQQPATATKPSHHHHQNKCVAGRGTIRFSTVTELHASPWTSQEATSAWYSRDELSALKNDRKRLVKALKKVDFHVHLLDHSQHCIRGYEAYLSVQANRDAKQRRHMALRAVLQEQHRQKICQRRDALMLSLTSEHATQWARDTAAQLGQHDAQVALQIFLDYMHEQEEQDVVEEEEEQGVES